MFAADNNGGAIVGAFILIGLYFIPLIVAALRHVPNVGSVAVINIFLGWTIIGWVVALAMACRSAAPVQQVHVYQQAAPPQQFRAPAPPTPIPGPPSLAAPAAPQQPTAAAWYPDPLGRSRLRYFDGSTWTDHVSD